MNPWLQLCSQFSAELQYLSAEVERDAGTPLWRAFESAVDGAIQLAGDMTGKHAHKCEVTVTPLFLFTHTH